MHGFFSSSDLITGKKNYGLV